MTITSLEAAVKQVIPHGPRVEPEPVADSRQGLTRLITSDHLDDLGLSGGAATDGNASCPKQLG